VATLRFWRKPHKMTRGIAADRPMRTDPLGMARLHRMPVFAEKVQTAAVNGGLVACPVRLLGFTAKDQQSMTGIVRRRRVT
jgi:hypothetical protein